MADSPHIGDEEKARRRKEKKEKKEQKEKRRQERDSRHAAEESRRSGQSDRAGLHGNRDPNPTIVIDTQQSTNSVEVLSPRRALPSMADRAASGPTQVQATASPHQKPGHEGKGGSHRKRGRDGLAEQVGSTPAASAAPERPSVLLSTNVAGSSSPPSGLPAGAIQINKQLVDVSQLNPIHSSGDRDRSRGSQNPTQARRGAGQQRYEIFTDVLFGPRVLLEDITDPTKPIILLPNGINGASAVIEGHSYRTTRFVGAHPICAGAFEACDYLGPVNFMSRSQLLQLTEEETRRTSGGDGGEAATAEGGHGPEFRPNGWQMYVASRQGQSLRSIAQEWKQLPAEEKALFRARAAVLFE